MNSNRQFLLPVILFVALVSTAANLHGQTGVIPVHAIPYVQPVVQPVVQQVPVSGLQSPPVHQPIFNQQVGFTQYVRERYPLDSQVDYTPEVISTYTPLDGRAARQIGVSTVTEYALGYGKHSPLNPSGVAQASYFQPVANLQPVAQFQPAVQLQPAVQFQPVVGQLQSAGPAPLFGNASNRVAAPSQAQFASLDERPRLFFDQNIGGGRSIFKAFWDRHWTRMVLVYGGFGNSEDSGADIFDGQASTNLGVVGVDIGRRHSRFMRSSIDFTYRGGDVEFEGQEAGQVRIYSLMKNFHLDLKRRGPFRPYVGVGIGGGVLDAQANLGDDFVDVQDEGSFVYQIIGGAALNVSDLAALYAEYRFFSLTSLDVASSSGIVEGTFTTHDFLFGLRFGY